MKILSVNAGSSSLKFTLIEMPAQEVIASGYFEKIGLDGSFYTIKYNGEKITKESDLADHAVAVKVLMDELVNLNIISSLSDIEGVGHRLVHGGQEFTASVVLNEDILERISKYNDLAPLHNPANIMGVKAFMEVLPGVIQVGVFDTAFHTTMAATEYLYPVPYEWYEEYQGTAIMPVYGSDGSIAGYDSDGDGEIDDSADELRHVELTPTFSGSTSGASIKGIKPGTTSVVVRSKVRPEVYAKITVNVTPEVPLGGVITITPDTLELSPDSDKVLITANVSADEEYVFSDDVDVEISVDDDLLVFSSKMWDQDGETWSCYASPNPLAEPGEAEAV